MNCRKVREERCVPGLSGFFFVPASPAMAQGSSSIIESKSKTANIDASPPGEGDFHHCRGRYELGGWRSPSLCI